MSNLGTSPPPQRTNLVPFPFVDGFGNKQTFPSIKMPIPPKHDEQISIESSSQTDTFPSNVPSQTSRTNNPPPNNGKNDNVYDLRNKRGSRPSRPSRGKGVSSKNHVRWDINLSHPERKEIPLHRANDSMRKRLYLSDKEISELRRKILILTEAISNQLALHEETGSSILEIDHKLVSLLD